MPGDVKGVSHLRERAQQFGRFLVLGTVFLVAFAVVLGAVLFAARYIEDCSLRECKATPLIGGALGVILGSVVGSGVAGWVGRRLPEVKRQYLPPPD